ncbi:hypothetical protein [Streptomyces sp. NPDC088725]|uniref:hypothetical protein n=1 Tax=Streptomyces sp. NPDC088725 TaxID=3365873 RepID=UPI0038144F0D
MTSDHAEDPPNHLHSVSVAGVVALVFLCRPTGGEERTSAGSTDVRRFTREEVRSRMPEAYSVRVLDALDGDVQQVRTHDGRRLTG